VVPVDVVVVPLVGGEDAAAAELEPEPEVPSPHALSATVKNNAVNPRV
jgi:hypothetical protein